MVLASSMTTTLTQSTANSRSRYRSNRFRKDEPGLIMPLKSNTTRCAELSTESPPHWTKEQTSTTAHIAFAKPWMTGRSPGKREISSAERYVTLDVASVNQFHEIQKTNPKQEYVSFPEPGTYDQLHGFGAPFSAKQNAPTYTSQTLHVRRPPPASNCCNGEKGQKRPLPHWRDMVPRETQDIKPTTISSGIEGSTHEILPKRPEAKRSSYVATLRHRHQTEDPITMQIISLPRLNITPPTPTTHSFREFPVLNHSLLLPPSRCDKKRHRESQAQIHGEREAEVRSRRSSVRMQKVGCDDNKVAEKARVAEAELRMEKVRVRALEHERQLFKRLEGLGF